jgi:hypothetical protein
MNDRPTKMISGVMRRPLLWGLLVSLLLHMPVLALLGEDWWNSPSAPETTLLEMTLQSAAVTAQVSGAAIVPEQLPAAMPAEAVVEAPPLPPPLPATLPPPLPAPLPIPVPPALPVQHVATVNNTVIVHTPVDSAALQFIPQPLPQPLLQPSPQPFQQPDPLALPQPDPPTVKLAANEVVAMAEVMNRLLQQLNEPDLNDQTDPDEGTANIATLDPVTLGLLASDDVEASFNQATGLTGLAQVDVAITRQIDGQPHQMRIRLQERALSHYAKFVNRWDSDVTLGDDRVDGRFHANSEVNFESFANPRSQFNGEVTIARRQALTRRVRESSMFAAGVRTGTGRIALPQTAFPSFWLESGAEVLTLNTDTRLDFQGAAGVVWTDINNGEQGRVLVPEAGLIIAGTGRARFEVSGDIAGRVLVYSPQRQMITGNLEYVDASEDSGDYLALISDGSIEVASATVTGPGDLRINAALFARDRFSVRRFSDRHQGVLYVYGSLVAGSVSATEPRYSTHIVYDPRFEHNRPPAFPGTGLYDVLDWEQHWIAVSDPDALPADVVDSAVELQP